MEALWSQFENVVAKDPEAEEADGQAGEEDLDGQQSEGDTMSEEERGARR